MRFFFRPTQFRKTFETFNTFFFPSFARIFETRGNPARIPHIWNAGSDNVWSRFKVLMISFTGEGEEGEDLALLKASLAYIINEPANNFPKFFFLFQRTEIKNDFLPREKKNGTCILINREMFLRKIQQLARVNVTTFESLKFRRRRPRKSLGKVGNSEKF